MITDTAIRNPFFSVAMVGLVALVGCQGTNSATSSYSGTSLNKAGVRTAVVAAPSFDRDGASGGTMRVPVPKGTATKSARKATTRTASIAPTALAASTGGNEIDPLVLATPSTRPIPKEGPVRKSSLSSLPGVKDRKLKKTAEKDDLDIARGPVRKTVQKASAGRGPGGNAGQRRQRYASIIRKHAKAHGVPVKLAMAVVEVESMYRPNARGAAGEIGLMQIMPRTARFIGYKGSMKALYNPDTNIRYGMKYLGKAHKLGGGSTCGTILKYNAGHGAKKMNPITRKYCKRIAGIMRRG